MHPWLVTKCLISYTEYGAGRVSFLPFGILAEGILGPIIGFIEPTCAYARWALRLHRFLSVTWSKFRLDQKSLDKKSYLRNIHLQVIKIGRGLDVDDLKVDLESQGHGSKFKITNLKKHYFKSHFTIFQVTYEVKGHMGLGQVTWVKVKGRPWRSRSPGENVNLGLIWLSKMWFYALFYSLTGNVFMVKGQMPWARDQKSYR